MSRKEAIKEEARKQNATHLLVTSMDDFIVQRSIALKVFVAEELGRKTALTVVGSKMDAFVIRTDEIDEKWQKEWEEKSVYLFNENFI